MHPAPESWMDYLYNEMSARSRRQHDDHLAQCPECRAQVEGWKSTLSLLDTDQGTLIRPISLRHPKQLSAPLGWAAAIAIASALGFAIGHADRIGRGDVQSMIAASQEEWRREAEGRRKQDVARSAEEISQRVGQENGLLLQNFAREMAAGRAADQFEISHQMQVYNQERAMDYAELRRDLSALAHQTGSGFRQAESQFNWLANSRTPPLAISGTTGTETNTPFDSLH